MRLDRSNLAVICTLLFATCWAVLAGADEAALPAKSAQPAAEEAKAANLAIEQKNVAERFKRLEEVLGKLSQDAAKTDPRRASLLRQALAQSKDRDLDTQFDKLVDLLRKDTLGPAIKNQSEVRQDLAKLLELLLSEDRSKRIESEKARIREYLKRVNRLIKDQKGIEGDTAEGDAQKLADAQEKLAEKTSELSKDIEKNEGRGGSKADSKDADDKEDKQGGEKSGKPGDKDSKDDKQGEKAGKDGAKSGDKKSGDQKAGDKKSGDPKDGKSGDDKQAGDDKNSGDNKDDKKPADDKKSGDDKDDKKDKSGGDKPDGKAGEPKPGEKPEKSGGKKGSEKAGKPSGKPKPGGGGEQDENDDDKPEQQPQQDDQSPAQKRLAEAEQRMKEAQRKLEEAKRGDAKDKQENALEALEQAKAHLEEILRQLREEEMERTLAMLEGRFRKMLEAQLKVYEGTKRADKVPEAERGREHEVEAGRLSAQESQIVSEADRALAVLHEEGSAVAMPEAIGEMRDDMEQVTVRLAQAKVNHITQGLEEDIIAALEEMIASLQKAQKDLANKKMQMKPGQAGEAPDPPLVDSLAEIKIIRALQMRVNKRTQRYAEMTKTEQAEKPELIQALRRLAEREQRIQRVTRDIAVGRNQ